MRIGLYIALICGILSGVSTFFYVDLFPSLVFPIIIGFIGIIAMIWTFPNQHISKMLKVFGILINAFPVLAGILQIVTQ